MTAITRRSSILQAAAVAVMLAVVRGQEPAPAFDVVLPNGTVIDGTGAARYSADIAIADGYIAKIGSLARERAAVEIDASDGDAPARVTIDIRRAEKAGVARGTIKVADPRTRFLLQSTSLGVLQPAARWASVSGRARIAGEMEEAPFTLVIDADSPDAGAWS